MRLATTFPFGVVLTGMLATLPHPSARAGSPAALLRPQAGHPAELPADEAAATESKARRAVAACRAALADRPAAQVVLKLDDAVCFQGSFHLRTEDDLNPLLDGSRPLVVRSIGGEGIAAGMVALRMLDVGVDVAVLDYCLSACANWVLLAGRTKYVADGSLVAWHGIPTTMPSKRTSLLDNGRLAMTYSVSQSVFDRLSCDPALAGRPDTGNPAYERWRANDTGQRSSFWTWSPSSLRTRFGVGGITHYWYPSDPDALQALARKFRINLLIDPA
jgi:hypothetical protein